MQPVGSTTYSKITRLQNDIDLFLGYKTTISIDGQYIKLSHDLDKRPFKTFSDCNKNILDKLGLYDIPVMGGFLNNGNVMTFDLATMPHLLISGTTGSGKSIYLHDIIMSLMYNDNVRVVPIDVKRVEFGIYETSNAKTHLYYGQVIKDAKTGLQALKSLCNEMDNRYKILENACCRDIKSYNNRGYNMEYIVIIIDELADLMLYDKKAIEKHIQRIAQLGRASGIHLICATQRPSTDVITGVIKANFPCRIALQCANGFDSATILGHKGAEALRGKGDMITKIVGYDELRLQAPYIDENIINQYI